MKGKGEVVTTSKISSYLEKQLSKAYPDEFEHILFVEPHIKNNNNKDTISDNDKNNGGNDNVMLDGHFDFMVIVDFDQSKKILL